MKSIKFSLPIIEEDMDLRLEDDKHVETVVLLSQLKPDDYLQGCWNIQPRSNIQYF